MWERGARHNPLSYRYTNYQDNRPVLSQDETLDWIWGRHTNHIYFFKMNGKFLCSNNIPVSDRIKMMQLMNMRSHFASNASILAIIPAVFSSGVLFSLTRMPYKALYPLSFYLLWQMSGNMMMNYYDNINGDTLQYYLQKYRHLMVNEINEVKDPQRAHFRLDTSSYYRQHPNEVVHAQHSHDTSDHYGAYPVRNIFNIFSIMIMRIPIILWRLTRNSLREHLSLMMLIVRD